MSNTGHKRRASRDAHYQQEPTAAAVSQEDQLQQQQQQQQRLRQRHEHEHEGASQCTNSSTTNKANDNAQDGQTSTGIARDKNQDIDSQIVKFYGGKCVLVTGASGFVGKLIIEKLLRTCESIKKIFVLMRPKRNKSARERFNELFDSIIFDTLKARQANDEKLISFDELKRKVVLLQGELTQPFLGLSIELLLQLADECSIILHSAAAVNFKGNFRNSLQTNLSGTNNVLQLASKLPRLQAFVHVSTCYSNCPQKQVCDHIYPVNVDPRTLIDITQTIDDETIEFLGSRLLGEHPNMYTYTKQLTEYLCAQFAYGPEQLPIVISRPSIIISTYEEPLKAFVDNRNAGNGIFDGISRGLMRSVNGKVTTIMDIVPADFVVNCTIGLGWFCDLYHRVRVRYETPPGARRNGTSTSLINVDDELVKIEDKQLEKKMIEYYHERKRSLRLASIQFGLDERMIQLPVFHVSSGVENPITFNDMFKNIAKYSLEFPCSELFRKPYCRMIDNTLLNRVNTYFQHTLVGKLMDLVGPAPRKRVGMRSSTWSNEFMRLDKFNSVLSYFYSNSFKFYPDNRLKLIEVFMNEQDRKSFQCDMVQVDWDSFSRDITLGIRKYLIGEPESTQNEARARLTTTLWRNSLLQIIFITLTCYIILNLTSG